MSSLQDSSEYSVWSQQCYSLVNTRPLISMFSDPCTNPLQSAPITFGITVTFMFQFSSKATLVFFYISSTWCFSQKSEWQRVSKTHLSILADFSRSVVKMVSIFTLLSSSPKLLSRAFGTIPSVPNTTGITVIFMFHGFFNSLARSKYLSIFSLPFIFTLYYYYYYQYFPWVMRYKLLATVVKGDPKAPFSIATTPRCKGGGYSFLWLAPLYPWSLPYNAECKVASSTIFESLVWLDLGLNPGHWWTL